jgi:hypothetical protein
MNYGKSFTFVFEDENWLTKFLIGVVVSLIPIVNFAAYGYVLEIVKNVRDGRERPLPEWDDFGGFFMNGLKFLLGTLVYALPAIIVSFFTIPFAILAGEDPGAIFGLGMTAVACLVTLLALLPVALTPVLMVQYAKKDQISDMFKFAEMWDMIQADFGTYIIILLFLFFVLSFVGAIGLAACFIGVIFSAWYSYLVAGHITGQFAARQPGAEKIA